MATKYQILAYSPSLHQEVEWFNLQALNGIQDSISANQHASAHAQNFNNIKHMNVEDWEPRWRLIEVGIETLPGYKP